MSRLTALAAGVASMASIALAACESSAAPDARASAWSLGPPLPRRVLAPGVGALGLEVAVIGGLDAMAGGLDASAEVDAFDTGLGSWGRLPDAPVRWTDGNVAAVGGTLYLAGGFEGQGAGRVARGDLLALDPLDRTWKPLPAMPAGSERAAAGVVATPGVIYLLGGASSTGAVSGCLAFDIATRTWSALPDLPAPRAHPAAMRRSDGSLIVAGGFAGLDQSDPRGEVWRLPPGPAQAWQQVAPMPVPRGGCVYGAVLGQLTCAGGAGDASAEPPVESYDPYNDGWTMRDPMPVARANVQGAAVASRLFVPGGSPLPGAPGAGNAGTEPTDTLYIYAPLDVAPR